MSDRKLIDDLKSQLGIAGERRGVEFCEIYDNEWPDIIRLVLIETGFDALKAENERLREALEVIRQGDDSPRTVAMLALADKGDV